jgi:2-isopropylmalate synthase
VEIAALLVQSGVDAIECGHPAVSISECERIRAVRRVTSGTPLLCHARAVVDDVEQVASVGADWVGIFLGVNDMSLAAKLRSATPTQALRRVRDATQAARQLGLNVRFTVEDTSRTPSARALDAYRTALEAGASRLCFADTVGTLAPREVESCIGQLVAAFPDVPIEVHLHDDRGLAIANALAAVEAGATWISTSVNGLGERCGIVDLAAMLANLEYLSLKALRNPTVVQELATRVGVYSLSPPDSRRPVIGAHAFTHTPHGCIAWRFRPTHAVMNGSSRRSWGASVLASRHLTAMLQSAGNRARHRRYNKSLPVRCGPRIRAHRVT